MGCEWLLQERFKAGEQNSLQLMEELVMLQLCFGLSVILFGLYAWNREQPH